jgi:hypothetical protein
MPKKAGGAPNKKKMSASEVYRIRIAQEKMSSVAQLDAEKGEFLEGAASDPSPSTQLAHLEQLELGGGADAQDTTVDPPLASKRERGAVPLFFTHNVAYIVRSSR